MSADTHRPGAEGANSPKARAAADRGSGLYAWIQGKKSAGSRIDSGSWLYTRVLPAVILALGLLTAVLILLAAGVLLGLVPFR